MDIILFWGLYFTIQGAIVGSFLNVLVDRLPKGKSLLGRSSCDWCGRKLGPLELIPIFSYLFINGKSTCCQKKISIRYSIVEMITALAFGFVSILYFSQISTQIISPLYYWGGILSLLIILSTSIAISLIDFDHHIIPDSLQIVLFLGSLLYVFSIGQLNSVRFAQAFLVAMPILLLYLGTKGRGMGYGDIKLAYTLGFWLGLVNGAIGLYFGFIIGAAYGIILMAIHKAGRKSHIAFGPFLLIGAWLAYYLAPYYIRVFNFL